MRFYGIALLTSAAVLSACGGEKQPATDSAATAATTPAATPTPTRLHRLRPRHRRGLRRPSQPPARHTKSR